MRGKVTVHFELFLELCYLDNSGQDRPNEAEKDCYCASRLSASLRGYSLLTIHSTMHSWGEVKFVSLRQG